MIPSEHEEQKGLMQWAGMMTCTYPELALLHAIPNGGGRRPGQAGRLKAEGVKPGVPDLCLPVARCGAHGLYIEMKRRKGGSLSPEQRDWASRLREQGYSVACCAGADEAMRVIAGYLMESDASIKGRR